MRAEYPRRIDECSDRVKPNTDERVSFMYRHQKEETMSHVSHPRALLRTRLSFATTAAVLLLSSHASASQGPGISPGTASASLQLTMTIAVYGLCAAAIAAGLIGAFRKS